MQHVDSDEDGGGGDDDNDNSIQHIQSIQYLARTLYARSYAKSIYIGTHVILSHIVLFKVTLILYKQKIQICLGDNTM